MTIIKNNNQDTLQTAILNDGNLVQINDDKTSNNNGSINTNQEPKNGLNGKTSNVTPRWGPNHAGAKYLASQYTRSMSHKIAF